MFLYIILALLVLVTVVTLLALPHVFTGQGYRVMRALVLAVNALTVLGLAIGPIVLADSSLVTGVASVLLRLAAVSLVVQVLFALLTGLSCVWQRLAGLRGNVPYDRGRRRAVRHGIVIPALALAGGLYGDLYEKDATVERELMIPVRDLPSDLRGLRIAQLSDVHLGWFFSLDDLRALLERTAEGAPDVLVLTGDIFDDDDVNLQAVALIDSYVDRFPLGIWFIYGNHEHFRDIEAIDEALAGTRIHKLVNASAVVQDGEHPLVFVGADYPRVHGDEAFTAARKEFCNEAFADVPQGAVAIFLAHHPEFIDDGAARGAALVLTGHTHGGQFCVLGHPLFPVFRYNRGLVHVKNTYGYVHSGNGSWFPYRIGCPPEIAYFTLRRA